MGTILLGGYSGMTWEQRIQGYLHNPNFWVMVVVVIILITLANNLTKEKHTKCKKCGTVDYLGESKSHPGICCTCAGH